MLLAVRKKLHRFKNIRLKNWRHTIKVAGFVAAALLIFSLRLIVIVASSVTIPDFSTFNDRKVIESTKIYDRTRETLLYDVHDNIKRTSITLTDISPAARNAAIAIEDDQFYTHEGIRITSLMRALLSDIFGGGYVQGGSTITQQVVKNTLLTPEKTITRKIKEIILALKIERAFTKDEILELYLNETPYGGNIYGIEEASKAFFGKHANEVDLAQSAYLAALPQAPTYFSPYGNNRTALDARKNLVLDRMLTLGFIDQQDYDTAKAEQVTFLPKEKYGIKAPHFVEVVKEYLAEKYGEGVAEQGGLQVTTTLDYTLQQKAEEAITTYGDINEKSFNAHNAGMVGIDPKTGQVLLMVGSRDYFDTAHEGNFNVTLAHRQPGSSFKPFVYATAFEKGYGPESVVFDVPTQFDTGCGSAGGGCYSPENYDNVFRGPMSLRDALAQSVNIPAVKTLYLSGIKDSIETAHAMGITSLTDPARYGLTLVLGGGEVSLLEMTSAYGVFANEGVRNPYAYILEVRDKNGNVLEQFDPKPKQALNRNTALIVSDILKDNVARTPLYGTNSPLYLPGTDVAVKTGTTNDYRDTWTVGYTPTLALGAWVGNNDNTPMEKKISGLIVTPMWHAVMQAALDATQPEQFPAPQHGADPAMPPIARGLWQGGISYFIDKISGKRATPETPDSLREERVVQSVHSELFWINKNDPTSGIPSNPNNDPQFHLWEPPVRAWAAAHGYVDQSSNIIPTAYDDAHTASAAPVVAISSPLPGGSVLSSGNVLVSATETGSFPFLKAEIYVNDVLMGTTSSYPISFSFSPQDIAPADTNTIRVVVYDTAYNRGSAVVNFLISEN